MTRNASRGKRNATLPFYLAAVVLALAAAIALAAYPVELGLARPGTNARRVVVAAAEIDATLDGEADFVEFSEALYAALAAHRALAVYNSADNRVDHAIGKALDCYAALRESWQAELEGSWDPAIHGDPAYWRSFHTAVELPGDDLLGAAEVRESLRREARAHIDEVLSLVER